VGTLGGIGASDWHPIPLASFRVRDSFARDEVIGSLGLHGNLGARSGVLELGIERR
jgi:hypothetical protein